MKCIHNNSNEDCMAFINFFRWASEEISELRKYLWQTAPVSEKFDRWPFRNYGDVRINFQFDPLEELFEKMEKINSKITLSFTSNGENGTITEAPHD